MGISKIGMLEADGFSPHGLSMLEHIGSVALWDGKNLPTFLADKHILFIRLGHNIDSLFFERCPTLRYLCSPTTGLNHVDMREAKVRGVKVISLQGERGFLAKIRATPEHALGLTLGLLRKYSQSFIADVRDWNRDLFVGEEIYGSTVGIIGYGRIGKILRRYFTALGARVLVYDADPAAYAGCPCSVPDAARLIRESSIILLAASYSPETGIVIDRPLIDLMRGKYFINTARGELVDEGYLLQRIREGFFKGVAIDVVSNEVYNKEFVAQLLHETTHQNLIVTPHIGGATHASMRRTEEFICKKLLRDMAGK